MELILVAYYVSQKAAELAAKELGFRSHQYHVVCESAGMDTDLFALYQINRFNID